jgi:UDP-glucose 4-epimerase
MKVLVTGGAGFIGSHIVELLLENEFQPIVVDNLSTGRKEWIPGNVTFYEADIQSQELENIFSAENPDYVIHQAAQVDVSSSELNPLFDARNNILATINLLTCCCRYNVKKIIYASSCAVYGETNGASIKETSLIKPISFYGISKYTPELYIKAFHELYKLPYTILRYANVYGPRQFPKGEGGVVSIFLQTLLNGKTPIIFGDGNQTRDFIHVKDVAKANVQAIYRGENELFNISKNEKTSINQLYTLISSLITYAPQPIYRKKRKGDIAHSKLDNTKAISGLGWAPFYDLNTGLTETLPFYQR